MLTTTPSEWNDDVSALHVLIENFGKEDPVAKWASHPSFGPLSGDEWGILSWKHLDYHLQQFGVIGTPRTRVSRTPPALNPLPASARIGV